jgi:hypothetical protein
MITDINQSYMIHKLFQVKIYGILGIFHLRQLQFIFINDIIDIILF